MHPIDFLANNPTLKPLRATYEHEIVDLQDSHMCSCCKRVVKQGVWAEEYAEPSFHCLSCHILFVGDMALLGKESDRGEGVPYKLGMMSGCGLYVDDKRAILYAPGKHFNKLNIKTSIFSGNISSQAVSEYSCEMVDKASVSKSDKCLLITNLGKKKASLVSNLAYTKAPNFCLSHEDGALKFNINDYNFYSAVAELPRATKKLIFSILQESARGELTLNRMNMLFGALGEAELTERYLSSTVDPHTRLRLVNLFK